MRNKDSMNNGIVIDAIDGEGNNSISYPDNSGTGLTIDTTTDIIDRVDLSNLSNNSNRSRHYQFTHTPSSNKVNKNTSSRVISPANNNSIKKKVSIADIAKDDEPSDKEVHISPIDDILNTSNPNSILSKYVKDKEEEAREWIAEKEEEKAVLEEEKEMELEDEDLIKSDNTDKINKLNNLSIYDDRFIDPADNRYTVIDNDINIDSILNDTDDDNNEEGDNDNMVDDELDIDSMIDKEDLIDSEELINSDDEEIEEESDDDEIEEEEPVVEKLPEEEDDNVVEAFNEEEEELIEDNMVSDESSFTPVVEEEEETTDTNTNNTQDETEVLKHLQQLATERLKPVSKKLDISSFTVIKKPLININPVFKESKARVVKWVLPSQKSIVLMKEFSGSELEKLREYSENNRSLDSLNRRYRMIYDHIMSPKPATFEQWLKVTPFEDVDHYFFAIYVASFKGANFLPEDCVNTKCGEIFMSDDINIMDMVKFENNEAKTTFADLYQSEATPTNGKSLYYTERVPVTNTIAISFRQPSISNAFEIVTLDNRTRDKYSAIIDYIPYIDTIYYIDEENRQLVPISYKTFPNDSQKTIRSKIQKYDSIFSTMSVDDFGIVKAYVRALTEHNSGISYVHPAVECPKCHTKTEEQKVSAEELVFTRYQLGSLVTTSLN